MTHERILAHGIMSMTLPGFRWKGDATDASRRKRRGAS